MQHPSNGDNYLTNEMLDELVDRMTKKLTLAMIGLAAIQIGAIALLLRLGVSLPPDES